MFLLPVLLGRFTYSPAVDGIVKVLVVEIVKSVEGLVRMYLKVPFNRVSHALAGVVRVPAILQVSVVDWDVPLLTVTRLKIVSGVPAVLVILAEVEPVKNNGILPKSALACVPAGALVIPLALFIRLPPIVIDWFVPPDTKMADRGAILTSPPITKFCAIAPLLYQTRAPPWISKLPLIVIVLGMAATGPG
jgi:hypothetical protein